MSEQVSDSADVIDNTDAVPVRAAGGRVARVSSVYRARRGPSWCWSIPRFQESRAGGPRHRRQAGDRGCRPGGARELAPGAVVPVRPRLAGAASRGGEQGDHRLGQLSGTDASAGHRVFHISGREWYAIEGGDTRTTGLCGRRGRRSLSAAARRLHLSQSALWQTIQSLERQLGVQLLLRSRTGVTTTEAGGSCYARAARSLHSTSGCSRPSPAGKEPAPTFSRWAYHWNCQPICCPVCSRS